MQHSSQANFGDFSLLFSVSYDDSKPMQQFDSGPCYSYFVAYAGGLPDSIPDLTAFTCLDPPISSHPHVVSVVEI